jgi:HK97 family phage prohead protease
MPVKVKYFFARVKQIDQESRSLEAVASTADLDRDEEIILPSAFIGTIASFKANPVILAAHQHRLASGSSPVIGSAIPESIQITDKEVDFKMRFASTALGEEYWQLYKDAHMRAFSVGFIPVKGNWQESKGKRVFIHEEIELLEISAVPVPSNRAALARSKTFYEEPDQQDLKSYVEDKLNSFSKEISSLRESIESSLEDIKSLLVPGSDEFADVLLSGEDPVESIPCKDKDKAGQSLLRIKNAFKIYGE